MALGSGRVAKEGPTERAIDALCSSIQNKVAPVQSAVKQVFNTNHQPSMLKKLYLWHAVNSSPCMMHPIQFHVQILTVMAQGSKPAS